MVARTRFHAALVGHAMSDVTRRRPLMGFTELYVRSVVAACRGSYSRAAKLLGVTPSAVRYRVDPVYRAACVARTRSGNADPVPRPAQVKHLRAPGGRSYCGKGTPDPDAPETLRVCEQCRKFKASYDR